ncbi:rRNA biogenesis protein RRP36 [Cryptococcus wingfieldii CBS 7118]|uniref:rRNA biogenesis protein RRP36 n=1 Tax=Cryptococcus wingfieldii CBS 7118 TaxID=1295528 RepID=A0A1E3K7I7_9TREE|nr:rRNA biogenesis protein RRP36 [Cryptococcus wingfieldii CBS 7118]ODO08497.1 rRNA biogenesis protein RRP36 [Cryptococcus wingfieldii CBS 7118]
MAKASSSKSHTQRAPSIEDDYLQSDSEEDEFAQGYAPGIAEQYDDDEEDDDEDDIEDDSEEEEGGARWEPDQWNEDQDTASESDGGSEEESDDDSAELVNLKSLPLATLAKAQKSLGQKASSSSSTQSKEEKLAAAKAKLAQLQRGKGRGVSVTDRPAGRVNRDASDSDDSGPESAAAGRSNKHAPAAMSTKRQVTRKRQVIDVPKPERRDPRFSSLSAGHANADLHHKSYSFLPSLLKEELVSLKAQVAAAKKAEKQCSLRDKPQRVEERERLEEEMGRVRTRLARGEKEELERETLAKAKKEEREKRESGKGAWYMKKGEKRDLLLKARFEDLEKSGGKTAVKKLVERKRKKIAGKEKKSRPFAPGGGSVGEGGKRRRVA